MNIIKCHAVPHHHLSHFKTIELSWLSLIEWQKLDVSHISQFHCPRSAIYPLLVIIITPLICIALFKTLKDILHDKIIMSS